MYCAFGEKSVGDFQTRQQDQLITHRGFVKPARNGNGLFKGMRGKTIWNKVLDLSLARPEVLQETDFCQLLAATFSTLAANQVTMLFYVSNCP
jgi:hypothetical protein